MKDAFDRLAKNLAAGMSRREAFQRFASGMALALGGLFTGRSSQAQSRDVCVEFCWQNCNNPGEEANQRIKFAMCMAESARCPEGECAIECYGKHLCIAVF
jgi:hypothetical protein